MASTLLPPPVAPAPKKLAPRSGRTGNGSGGGNAGYRPEDWGQNSEPDPERWGTPLDAYRTASLFVVFSIMSVFATLTHVLESRWVYSKDWVSIALPHILYLNTAVLVASSLTIERARASARRRDSRRCSRWLLATLVLGVAFVAGQLVAWRELVSRGLYVASNPGSFFFYFLTAAHAVHLFGGILALGGVVVFAGRLARNGHQPTAVSAVALYWHFMDGLWVYLLALLLLTIQR
jgi:cytochrome c oxidase subunit III